MMQPTVAGDHSGENHDAPFQPSTSSFEPSNPAKFTVFRQQYIGSVREAADILFNHADIPKDMICDRPPLRTPYMESVYVVDLHRTAGTDDVNNVLRAETDLWADDYGCWGKYTIKRTYFCQAERGRLITTREPNDAHFVLKCRFRTHPLTPILAPGQLNKWSYVLLDLDGRFYCPLGLVVYKWKGTPFDIPGRSDLAQLESHTDSRSLDLTGVNGVRNVVGDLKRKLKTELDFEADRNTWPAIRIDLNSNRNATRNNSDFSRTDPNCPEPHEECLESVEPQNSADASVLNSVDPNESYTQDHCTSFLSPEERELILLKKRKTLVETRKATLECRNLELQRECLELQREELRLKLQVLRNGVGGGVSCK